MLHLSYFLTVHWFVIWAVVNDSTEHGTDFMMVQSILFLSVSSTRCSKKLYQEYIKTSKTFKVIVKKKHFPWSIFCTNADHKNGINIWSKLYNETTHQVLSILVSFLWKHHLPWKIIFYFLNIQSLRLKLWTNLQIASFSSFANVLLMSLPMCLKIKMRKVQYTNYFVSQFIISCHCLKLTAKYRLHVCAAKMISTQWHNYYTCMYVYKCLIE